MPAIVFSPSSAPGASPQEGSGRLINCYAVKTEVGSRAPFKWPRSAGLREILNITGHSHCRGGILIASTLILVLDQRVYTVTESVGVFTAVNRGALSGTDAVTISRNNAATPNIVLTCAAGTFNLFTNSAPTAFADGDLPASNSTAGLNGYIFFSTGSGEIWATGLNGVTVGTDANTNAQIKPDGLRRLVSFRGELFAMGDDSIQVFEETGDTPFPLRYKKITIPHGICGTHAVAGYEDGWGGQLFWVGEDNILGRLDGYTRVVVGNDDLTRAIATAADRTLIEMSVYMDGQYAMVAITSPGEWTWEYNATTGLLHERQSYDRADWRARRAFKAFNRWIVGDATTGKFAQIDNTYRKEYNEPLIWHIESGDNAKFPYGLAIPAIFLDFVAGAGNAAGEDPIETDPVVMISWSFNGGAMWGNEITRALGQQGKFNELVRVNRVGTSKGKGFRVKVRVSDPVNAVFLGGTISDEVQTRAA